MKGQLQIFSAGRRREGSQPGTPENLRCAEEEASNFDISLDLEDRESVFSPAPGDTEMEPVEWVSAREPLLVQKKVERTEQEKREIEADLEKLAERLAATLSAACSKKEEAKIVRQAVKTVWSNCVEM